MARKRGKRWQADVTTPDGTRHRPTFAARELAEKWEEEARSAIEDGRPLPEVTVKAQGDVEPLRTLGGLYNHVLRTEWSTMKSAAHAQRNGKEAVDYFGANRDPSTITSAEVAEYRASILESGRSPATANRRLAALSKMLRVGAEAGVVARVPKIKRTREGQTKFRYLDEAEESALLTYWRVAELHDIHDLTVLLIDTGARVASEMLPVTWEDFGKDFSTVTFWTTKADKPRTLPLTKRSRDILRERKRAHPQWPGPFTGLPGSTDHRDRGLTQNTLRSKWDTMREVLGFHDVTPHTLRHTCCTRLVLGGADVKRVMTWMGHSAIVTTMRYMQIRPSALEDLVELLEPTA